MRSHMAGSFRYCLTSSKLKDLKVEISVQLQYPINIQVIYNAVLYNSVTINTSFSKAYLSLGEPKPELIYNHPRNHSC